MQTLHATPYQQNILKQCAFVAQNATHVHLNAQKLQELAAEITSGTHTINREWTEDDFKHHFTDGTEKTVKWLFLSSALNFSFWDGKAEEPWSVEVGGTWVPGYWALTAALKKAMEKHDILNPTFLENMTLEILSDILKGSCTPPLMEERVRVCRGIGRTINEKLNGDFMNLFNAAEGSAVTLANLVATYFEEFRDVTTYKGEQIPILKRAQIFAADVWGAFKGENLGNFHDLNQITIFADYKLPQFLRAMGVMEYSPALAQKVDTFQMLPSGSDEETQIRALTIHTVEELRKACGGKFSAIQLDWWIWHASFSGKYPQAPHHLTRSVYY